MQLDNSRRMAYTVLASLCVGDSLQLSGASRPLNELYRVIAIERDVDELGRPLPGLSHPRTIRILTRRATVRDTVARSFFFATEG
jgi:hypothetical protein